MCSGRCREVQSRAGSREADTGRALGREQKLVLEVDEPFGLNPISFAVVGCKIGSSTGGSTHGQDNSTRLDLAPQELSLGTA